MAVDTPSGPPPSSGAPPSHETDRADTLVIGGETIYRGQQRIIELQAAKLYDFTDLSILVKVIRGRRPGPVMFLSAAIHGDEINGVEIVRRVLARRALEKLRGSLLAVPIVNVFGFNNRSRYLPDGRDLNRFFPGSDTGSLTSRIAQLFREEVVSKCTHGIDLHTGARHRQNLPQVRACVDDEETERLARAFGVPVILNSALRDGSLRECARELGIPMLLFEGGEALRFDEAVVSAGVRGVLNVMRAIGMLKARTKLPPRRRETFVAQGSHWVRAPHSGILTTTIALGTRVTEGQLLGRIGDPFGTHATDVTASRSGIVIGDVRLPLVSRGDALFHVATFDDLDKVQGLVEEFNEQLLGEGS